MKLRQWVDKTQILPTHPTTECQAVSITIDQLHPNRRELWSLKDYVVSSVSGVVVWLVPRKQESRT